MAIAQLRLKQGVPAAPGDPNSAEQGIIKHINLMSPEGVDGFRLDTSQNWTPQRAQWKNGGVWVESAINDGRQLLAAARGNVLETIPLILVAESQNSINFYMRELGRFAQAVTDVQEGRSIEPTYLELEGVDAPGGQWAAVFMVNIADRNLAYPDVGQKPAVGVTLTIEREAGWRMLWPGVNPIECHFQLQGKTRGVTTPGEGYTYSDMSLYENTDHFHYELIKNRVEINPTSYSTLISKNWIDITGTDIPGDMPALCCINIEAFDDVGVNDSSLMQRAWIARSTKPATNTAKTGANPTKLQIDMINAGDATLVGGGGFSKTNDADGIISNGSSTLQYYATRAYAAGAVARQSVLRWFNDFEDLDIHTLRGTYAVYLRGLVSPNTAVDGDFNMWLTFAEDWASGFDFRSTLELGPNNHIPIITSGDAPGLTYFGMVTLPLAARETVGIDGRGIAISTDVFPSLSITLDIQKVNAANTRTVIIHDLVLLPIDECQVIIENDSVINTSFNTHFIFDNTGYFNRTGTEARAYRFFTSSATSKSPVSAEFSGRDITLIPGIDNRLYFMKSANDVGGTQREESRPGNQMKVRLNIVPRWSGIRDV